MSTIVFKSEVQFFDCEGPCQAFDEIIENFESGDSVIPGFTILNHAGQFGEGFPFVMPIARFDTLEAAKSWRLENQ